jgi:MOSC domain-containing protein YiiM
MRILSVNVGKPREITWNGRTLRTGIVKEPAPGPVAVRRHNLDGDQQANLDVHGGEHKAVYIYPAEHYDFWRAELGLPELRWGSFGENLTVSGIDEDVQIGTRLRAGTSELTVTEPRFPCSKLAALFQRPDLIKLFLDSRRSGFYLSVRKEGEVQEGDVVELLEDGPGNLRIRDVVDLEASTVRDPALLQVAAEHAALPSSWRERFRGLLGD